jgi:polysaccharide pyruvyl transferase WcaK-like protein
VLLGGGGLLTDDYTKKAPLLWFLHVLYIKLFRKPFVLVGNSIGPCHFFLSKFFVKKILQWSKENYIRDHASQKYIEETFQIRDTKKCSDCAFLFQIPKHQESLRKKKLLALNIRDWDMDFSELKIFIKNIMKQGYGVLFIPTEPKDTILFQEKIQHDAVIIHPKNFHQMILLLQKCEYAIGMRLHFLIGAMLAECKIGGIAYSKKVQGILEETDIPFVFPEHCTQKNLEHLFLKAKHPSSLEEKQKEVSDMFTALEKIIYR